jgi:hypothetical protein
MQAGRKRRCKKTHVFRPLFPTLRPVPPDICNCKACYLYAEPIPCKFSHRFPPKANLCRETAARSTPSHFPLFCLCRDPSEPAYPVWYAKILEHAHIWICKCFLSPPFLLAFPKTGKCSRDQGYPRVFIRKSKSYFQRKTVGDRDSPFS